MNTTPTELVAVVGAGPAEWPRVFGEKAWRVGYAPTRGNGRPGEFALKGTLQWALVALKACTFRVSESRGSPERVVVSGVTAVGRSH